MVELAEWDKGMDGRLVKAYAARREGIWTALGQEVGVSWRAVESRVFDLGKKKLAKR
jgi:hypothetical protein